jgi:hypothetical protein
MKSKLAATYAETKKCDRFSQKVLNNLFSIKQQIPSEPQKSPCKKRSFATTGKKPQDKTNRTKKNDPLQVPCCAN